MFKWLFKKKGCAKHMNNKLEVIGIDHGWSMMKTISLVFVTGVKEITTTPALFGDVLEYEGKLVLCQDLVQVKMRNFSHFNPPEAQPQCVFFYTIVRIHLVTYSYNGYEFVSYCRKLPDIRKSSGMPACNREF